ncbi:hypothetical protein Tco_1197802, partial [Tanacetum coccineum]
EEDELMNIESDLFTYNTITCESCHILAVDTDLFTYEIVTQETYVEIARKQNNGIREVWASCNPSNEECDGGSLRNNEIRCYWESENDNDRKILTEHWRKRFGVDYDDNNDFYDPDQCEEGTSDDEDDIEGIIDYLEPTSYDGFIDLDEEEYNKRRCRLLGMPYIEPLPLIIEQVKITPYSLGLG